MMKLILMASDSKTKLNKLLQRNGDFFGAHGPEKQLTLMPRGFLCHRRHHSQTGPAVRNNRALQVTQNSPQDLHKVRFTKKNS